MSFVLGNPNLSKGANTRTYTTLTNVRKEDINKHIGKNTKNVTNTDCAECIQVSRSSSEFGKILVRGHNFNSNLVETPI